MTNRYNNYSDFLKNKYGVKVYKLPISIPVTCPNRDGTCGFDGCSFCGDIGAGYRFGVVSGRSDENCNKSQSGYIFQNHRNPSLFAVAGIPNLL